MASWRSKGSKLYRGTLAVGMALVLAACASQAPTGPEAVAGRVLVLPGLNPNVEGRPSPVILRLYQLRDREAFMEASLQDLAMRDTETLGATLLGRDSFELCPVEESAAQIPDGDMACQGEERAVTLMLSPEVRYLAAMAEFYDVRDPTAQWRAVAALPRDDEQGLDPSTTFTITLDGVRVAVRFD